MSQSNPSVSRASRIHMSRRQRNQNQQRVPVGLVAGLLTGSLVTLVGIFCGNDPYVVLYRSTVSAILLGTLTSVGFGIIHLANTETPKESHHNERQ